MIGHPYRDSLPAARVHAPPSLREQLIDLAWHSVVFAGPISVVLVACVIANRIGLWETLFAIDLIVALAVVVVAILITAFVVLALLAFWLLGVVRRLTENDS